MANNLFDSFNKLYVWLGKDYVSRRALAILLGFHTLLLSYSAYVHSPTLNEPAHLAAGLNHWKFRRFDVYTVNPPLVRMIAALPVMVAGCVEDWSAYYEGPGARPEMALGAGFVKANAERSFILVTLARWACIPLSWIGLIVCYLWARDLYGRPAGVLAATIWCFEPNILAHASLITPDAFAAALGLAASYAFWRWLRKPTWTRVAFAGINLGLAVLAKTTLMLFYLLWPALWLVYCLPNRRSIGIRSLLRQCSMISIQLAIGIYILNLGYGFEESFTRLRNFEFVSDLFSGSYDFSHLQGGLPARHFELTNTRQVPDNRFSNTWLGELPVPLPKNFVLGLDTQQRDFEHYGRPSYLAGQWRERGWWYYYLYACAIKVPLSIWMMGLLVLLNSFGTELLIQPSSNRELAITWRDVFVLLSPGIFIFIFASSESGFSEHMRYVLPAFPYFFIAISQAARFLRCRLRTTGKSNVNLTLIEGDARPPISAMFVIVLTAWLVVSSLCIYPHCLSYFNEIIGGPLHGPEHLSSSNVDWGQDLLYVRDWCRKNPNAGTIVLSYFGAFDPRDTDIMCLRPLPAKTDPIQGKSPSNKELIAISTSVLYGTSTTVHGGQGDSDKLNGPQLEKLRNTAPRLRFGYSIYVFDP